MAPRTATGRHAGGTYEYESAPPVDASGELDGFVAVASGGVLLRRFVRAADAFDEDA